jgi:hypothetical protein
MSSDCRHLIIAKTKIVKPTNETIELNFLCGLKRTNKNIKTLINQTFRRQTKLSVSGYTCYYHTSKTIACTRCPKFQVTKQLRLFEKTGH